MQKAPVSIYVAGFGILFLFAISLFTIATAQSPANANRSLPVDRVDYTQTLSLTIPVTVNVEVNEPVSGLALDENVPEGWEVTEVENDGATFKRSKVQWIWLNTLTKGTTKTIKYDLTLPDEEDQGTYSIEGTLQSDSPSFESIAGGDSTIEVVETYPLTTNTSGSGSGTIDRSQDKTRYQKGEVVTLKADPDYGSKFSGWSGDLTGTNISQDLVMDSSKSVTATFDLKEYQVSLSVSPSGSGTVSGGGTYTHGSSVEISASPGEGYEFVSWSENGSNVSTDKTETLYNLTRGWDLQANFEKKTYQLTPSSGEHGTITPAESISLEYGGSHQFEIIPEDNYRIADVTLDGTSVLDNVTVDDTGTGTYTVENIQTNHSINATFEPVKRSLVLRFIGAGSGTVEVAANNETNSYGGDSSIAIQFDHGTNVTLIASPNLKSGFSGFSGDYSEEGSTLEILLNSDLEIDLKFDFTVPYVVSRWDRGSGRVKAGDDPSISLRQILTAVKWWLNDDQVPGTGGKEISLEVILDLIGYWAQGTKIASQSNTPMAFGSGTDDLSAGRSEDYLKNITHTVSSATLEKRKPIEVTISFTPTRTLDGLAVNYPVPKGWSIKPVDKDGSNYKDKSNQFLWLTLEAGERKSIAFNLISPENSAKGNYSLTGELMSSSPDLEWPIKPLTVTIGEPEKLSLQSALAYPNPVTSADSVTFQVKGSGIVLTSLELYNLAGKKIYSAREAGTGAITWDLTNKEGNRVSNGVYLYMVSVEGKNGKTARSNIQKLVVVN